MDTPTAANDRDLLTTVDVIAELCWLTHRAWEKIIGQREDGDDDECDFWNELDDDDQDRVRDSVKWFIEHPTASLSAEHDAWGERKMTIDPHHPNLVPYDELPFDQQVKLRLWRHTILAVIG